MPLPQEVAERTEDVPRLRLLSMIAICLVIGGGVFTAVTLVLWLQGSDSLLDVAGAAVVTAAAVLLYFLVRWRKVRAASLLLVGLLLAITAYYVFLEGTRSTVLLLLAGAIVFADLLLGGRSGLVVAAVTVVVYFALGLAHRLGWIQPAYASSFVSDVAVVALVSFGLALAAGFFTRDMHRALQQTREQEVALRTANAEKDHLLVELRDREQAQGRLLETIRELSTPAVPLMAGILLLPLVGHIDSGRAGQIMDQLLAGVREHRSRIVIVDITGVPVVDAMVAKALVQIAQAVRLLGAEVILVGIKPGAAQTMVGLGLDLTILATRADLRSGLEYAMDRLGELEAC